MQVATVATLETVDLTTAAINHAKEAGQVKTSGGGVTVKILNAAGEEVTGARALVTFTWGSK